MNLHLLYLSKWKEDKFFNTCDILNHVVIGVLKKGRRVEKETYEERLLDAFLDPFRLRIIDLLMDAGRMYPRQIAEKLNADRSKVVYHLHILEKADLVHSEYAVVKPHSSPAKFAKFYFVNEEKLKKAASLVEKYLEEFRE